jgi:hypothetical protein
MSYQKAQFMPVSSITTYTATHDEMDADGFEQNLTVEGTGICGDVNGNGKVNIGDVIRLANHVGFPADPRYTPICW